MYVVKGKTLEGGKPWKSKGKKKKRPFNSNSNCIDFWLPKISPFIDRPGDFSV
jgi:hypothetical protein